MSIRQLRSPASQTRSRAFVEICVPITRPHDPSGARYPGACIECRRLLTELGRLDRAYILAFQALINSSMGPPAEFARLRTAADDAWLESERIRVGLRKHKQRHVGRAQTADD